MKSYKTFQRVQSWLRRMWWVGLNALREVLDNRENKHIPIDDLSKMAEFILKTLALYLMVKLKNSC